MGNRYLLSGSQLGALIALCRTDAEACNNMLNEIIENQEVFSSDNPLRADIEMLEGIHNPTPYEEEKKK